MSCQIKTAHTDERQPTILITVTRLEQRLVLRPRALATSASHLDEAMAHKSPVQLVAVAAMVFSSTSVCANPLLREHRKCAFEFSLSPEYTRFWFQ